MFEDGEDETQHLIRNQHSASVTGANECPVAVINENLELLPPYTSLPNAAIAPTFSETGSSSVTSDVPVISCRVCQALVHVEDKLHLHVIKCHACGEATPIRPAPPMKKYVRCPCKCLLICNLSSQRIVCPRVNCRRVISLSPIPTNSSIGNLSPDNQRNQNSVNFRIICAYCHFSFVPTKSLKRFQLCPHCSKTSFTSSFHKKRSLLYVGLILFFTFCIATAALVVLLVLFKKHSYVYIYILVGFLGLIDVITIGYFIWLAKKKSSKIEHFSLQYT